jgi:hypothetical protein
MKQMPKHRNNPRVWDTGNKKFAICHLEMEIDDPFVLLICIWMH